MICRYSQWKQVYHRPHRCPPIRFTMYMSGLMNWVEERVSGGEGLSYMAGSDTCLQGTTQTKSSENPKPAPEGTSMGCKARAGV